MFRLFKKTDPAGISKLQRQFLRCLLRHQAAITALIVYSFQQSNQHNQGLIASLAALIYQSIKPCLDRYLKEAYLSGHYFVLKDQDQDKNYSFPLTVEDSKEKSYDLIKTALMGLTVKLFLELQLKQSISKAAIAQRLKQTFTHIAVTEPLRQKVAGAIDTLRSLGIKQVKLKAKYRTAGDNHVCTKCETYEGKVMSLDQVKALIPQHPYCRCWFSVLEPHDAT